MTTPATHQTRFWSQALRCEIPADESKKRGEKAKARKGAKTHLGLEPLELCVLLRLVLLDLLGRF